jgi:uncharacterized repeat protein (TIGR04138 family)
MSKGLQFWEAVAQICRRDSQFKPDAYGFVMESLEFTIQRLGERRHVSAEELLRGLCDHARDRFGLLAHTVLSDWGIHSAADVGRVVYYLIDAGVLDKRAEDRFEDFDVEYDFKKILDDEYFERSGVGGS